MPGVSARERFIGVSAVVKDNILVGKSGFLMSELLRVRWPLDVPLSFETRAKPLVSVEVVRCLAGVGVGVSLARANLM